MPPTMADLRCRISRRGAPRPRRLGRLAAARPGGIWTLKDIIAHLTWHEEQLIGVLTARALVGSDWWNLPLDERAVRSEPNAKLYLQNQARPLAEVLAESRRVFTRLIELIEALPQGSPFASPTFQDLPLFARFLPGWEPWKILAENTYEQYEQHLPQLRAWAAELTAASPGEAGSPE